jgi:hypothetical protein
MRNAHEYGITPENIFRGNINDTHALDEFLVS